MKAACVLLCLALAHDITGNIFNQQKHRVDDLDVQPLEYIDQNQRQQRVQSSEGQKQKDHVFQSKQYRDQIQSQLHRDQPQNQQVRDQRLQQYEEQSVRQQEQEQQYQPTYSQPSYYREKHQHSYSQNSQEQASTSHQRHSQNHHRERAHHHLSSSKSSEESKERKYYQNQQPNLRGDNQKWNSPLSNTVTNNDNQNVYNDIITWRGLQFAVGPNSPFHSEDDIEKIFGDAQKAMKHIPKWQKAKLQEVYELTTQEENEDAHLNATQLVQKYQYPVEEHIIKTDDGYVLTLFRIPPKKQIRDVQKRPVVFLMHGILGSADDWLLMGPGKSLAYLLSDAGYDVWLGNARGNKYSMRHVTKHPAMSDFWQYSTDEIALHDLPAMIDYALETTKQEKMYYIGHAQGTTAFFALTATRPEYNDKIIMMYALSPMVYMTNVRSPLFRMIAPTNEFEQRLGNSAFTPNEEMIHTIGGTMLESEIGYKKVSSNINFVMAGVNIDGLETNLIPVLIGHLPAGTSTKVIKQYGQGVASHEFRRYDFGPYVNEQVYGMQQPPKYNMAEVQAPVTLYYSEEDWLAHPKDVIRLQSELPNVKETYMVPEEHFSHMDFQFSTKAPEIVYKQLIESMQNQQ